MPVAHIPMRCFTIVLFFILAAASAGANQQPSVGRMTELVQTLTAPELAGRGSGTVEADKVAQLLAKQMQNLGLEPGFSDSWFQDFPLKGQGWNGEDLSGKMGKNVMGVLPGQGELAERFLVVGAHFDHLGRVKDAPLSVTPSAGQYYPGANDNASGLAALFELMTLISQNDRPSSCRSIIFVFFGAEEVGLQGSGYLVSNFPVSLSSIDCMINFDTIGQMTDNRLHVSGIGSSAVLPELVETANTEGLNLSLAQGGWSGSDHMSFNTREVPVLFIFGGPYTQYNTPDDTWDTLNYPGMAQIISYTHRLINQLAIHPPHLEWIMVAKAELRDHGGAEQNRDSWLGTLPDFTEDIQGYRLAGVFDGSPAAQAGLLKGDVLVLMAGEEVTDLPTFTRALRSQGPGELVEITVLRQGQTLNFTVVLGDRKNRK